MWLLAGLLHHTFEEILAVRVQPGFDFGEVGPQLFGHDDSRLRSFLVSSGAPMTGNAGLSAAFPPEPKEPGTRIEVTDGSRPWFARSICRNPNKLRSL